MKKMSKKLLASIMAVSLLAALVPAVGLADGIGTVGLETKLDNDIVVYENRFADEAAFNAVYNKDVDGGIHPIVNGSDGGVKYTYKTNFTGAGLAEANYGSTQIRTYNGNSKTKAKGFWIDLDHVLEQYGPGAYTFSFRVNSKGSPGLIEAVLNTAEDQTALENIIWGSHNATESSPYLNLGGHILCRRWDNSDALNNQTFTSTTYIPEGAQHLRFFFGGTDYDGAENSRNVGGGSTYLPVFFDDLVITKKANSYKDAALVGGDIKLKSTVKLLGGAASASGKLIAAMYDADTNEMLEFVVANEDITLTDEAGEQTVDSTLSYPGEEVENYTIKTFFFDDFNNLTPYSLSYNPHESLLPNTSFESPFTNDYRWTESGNNVDTNAASVYSGARGIGKGISSGGTYIKIGEGATASPGSNTAPGSITALAQMLLENGKGTYKFSFMAKTKDGNANLVLHFRPYYQNFSQPDVAVGYLDVATTRWSVGPQVATPEWQKFEFEIDFNPLASGETQTAGAKTGWLSYRKNNYGFYLVASSLVNATDVIYVDDFKVEKVN